MNNITANNGQSVGSQELQFNNDGKPRVNRDYCNKCKKMGPQPLLGCYNCPRSFHAKCLGIKQQSSENTPTLIGMSFAAEPSNHEEWYCATCQ